MSEWKFWEGTAREWYQIDSSNYIDTKVKYSTFNED